MISNPLKKYFKVWFMMKVYNFTPNLKNLIYQISIALTIWMQICLGNRTIKDIRMRSITNYRECLKSRKKIEVEVGVLKCRQTEPKKEIYPTKEHIRGHPQTEMA